MDLSVLLSSPHEGEDDSSTEYLDVGFSDRASPHRSSVDGAALASRSRVGSPGVVLGLVVGLVAAVAAVAFSANPSWPTKCKVDGHSEWCGEPSWAMSNPALAALAHDYCPKLSMALLQEVVPQPLSRMDLANQDTFAKTSGNAETGTEDALLGERENFAWITRWVGGETDGLVEVRCPGDTQTIPSMALKADQFRSTLAAANGADGQHIDFAEVARQSVDALSDGQPTQSTGTSFGFMACNTEGIDLSEPQVGRTFFCMVEVYGEQGKGGYSASYRVTADAPFFESADTVGQP